MNAEKKERARCMPKRPVSPDTLRTLIVAGGGGVISESVVSGSGHEGLYTLKSFVSVGLLHQTVRRHRVEQTCFTDSERLGSCLLNRKLHGVETAAVDST